MPKQKKADKQEVLVALRECIGLTEYMPRDYDNIKAKTKHAERMRRLSIRVYERLLKLYDEGVIELSDWICELDALEDVIYQRDDAMKEWTVDKYGTLNFT